MKLYNLAHLAGLYGPDAPGLSDPKALERAKKLRKTLHQLDVNEANNDTRYYGLPAHLAQKGAYLASGLGFAWAGPCSTPLFQPDPSESLCERLDLKREMAKLPARERQILSLRADGLTLEETASELGISKSRVQQLEKAAKKVLTVRLAVEV